MCLLKLRLDGRQTLTMFHREREIVPDGRTGERKSALSLELTSVGNTEDSSVSRAAMTSE